MPERRPDPAEPEYLVTTYRDGKRTEEHTTEEEKARRDPSDVDLFWDDTTGQVVIRKENGESIEFFGAPPGVGGTLRRLLFDLMWEAPGILDDSYVQRVTKRIGKPGRSIIIARLSKLRHALGESHSQPWFLLSRRYPFGLCFDRRRSWRHVDRIARPTGNGQ